MVLLDLQLGMKFITRFIISVLATSQLSVAHGATAGKVRQVGQAAIVICSALLVGVNFMTSKTLKAEGEPLVEEPRGMSSRLRHLRDRNALAHAIVKGLKLKKHFNDIESEYEPSPIEIFIPLETRDYQPLTEIDMEQLQDIKDHLFYLERSDKGDRGLILFPDSLARFENESQEDGSQRLRAWKLPGERPFLDISYR